MNSTNIQYETLSSAQIRKIQLRSHVTTATLAHLYHVSKSTIRTARQLHDYEPYGHLLYTFPVFDRELGPVSDCNKNPPTQGTH